MARKIRSSAFGISISHSEGGVAAAIPRSYRPPTSTISGPPSLRDSADCVVYRLRHRGATDDHLGVAPVDRSVEYIDRRTDADIQRHAAQFARSNERLEIFRAVGEDDRHLVVSGKPGFGVHVPSERPGPRGKLVPRHAAGAVNDNFAVRCVAGDCVDENGKIPGRQGLHDI